ncbi:DUF3971 domain-containing protein [Pseudaminobacter soli (ex Li et al. 2025)]|uniref:YhdP central domain-containing protein n=1 Tax=Pseudaminobacter soli (ex Li et al. 2025) TaxID=1295366 RepID=A0A2P7SNL1_9HYPH|nr:DUF3971 domain-containing protein [Mesorhizobium soli]PSJ64001.1 hypothetical protein C7I85_02495 [Mesorhizobium soli]
MQHELPKHQKIRFRRDEIADLGAYPSAIKHHFTSRHKRLGRRAGKMALWALISTAAVVGLVAVLLYLVGLSGIGTGPLRGEAERAISAFAGVDVAASLGPASLSIDGSRLIALGVDDVSIKTKQGIPIVEAGMVRFGLRFVPLLSGNVRLGSVKISNARINAGAMPMAAQGDWTAILRNDRGLIDADKVTKAIFAEVHRAFDALQIGSTRQIELEKVEFVLPEDGHVRIVRIDYAQFKVVGGGELIFSADLDIDGRKLQLAGTSSRDEVSKRISALQITANSASGAPSWPASAPPEDANSLGDLDLEISGQEGIGTDADTLKAALTLGNSTVNLGKDGTFTGGVDLNATLLAGSDKLEIDRLRVTSGRSNLEFNGAVGPRPANGEPGDKPVYRYELVSTSTTAAPVDSPEPALDFLARIVGTFDGDSKLLAANVIGINSGEGEAIGEASLDLSGGTPGISLALNVHDMPVAHVKQLWPWFAAKGARHWVMDHLFGGRVVDGRIDFKVPPDRLGNGIPLTADEVSGRFQVEGARFDTTGVIPPVRDAIGKVQFHGNDVDISLSSGTVYLTSGRSVEASNGTLRIEHANRPPLIGMLDMNVAGDAAAITELATYEPINAMRFVGMKPEEFAGKVTGNVKADIPLQKGIDTDRLDWRVVLDYEGLSLAKPFDNQKITDANGSITIEPNKAVIDAAAKLNGVPAEIAMVEPLGKDGPARQRKIQLSLDEKARATLAPGLSSLISGTVKVNLDAGADGKQKVSADLTNVQLDVPWAGWTKGAGIPASLSFLLEKSKDVSTLSDFKLEGKSFAIDGAVTLANGNLSSARFDTVQLNRDDDVVLSIKRMGKGYQVDIIGNSLDARPLIKQFTSGVGEGDKPTSSSTPISVNLDVKSLAGFGGEQLSNVLLSYSGANSQIDGLRVTATTGAGGAVSVTNSSDGGQHSLQMQSSDAGALLRFLNIYDHMQGGSIKLALSGNGGGPMRGKVDASDFWVVNEPKLASIVSTTPPGDKRSLNEAVKSEIDTSRVQFERGSAQIEKGPGYLKIGNGVLRGPLIGTTFQGTLYDEYGNMSMTGTFMPAYGLNRIFGEIPIVGAILGNGRDRGLIGVTYKLNGNAKTPNLQINPLSVIAPGIFRSIFEFQ